MDLKRFSKYGVATMVTAGAGVAAVAIFGGDGEPAVVKAPTALADAASAKSSAPAQAPAAAPQAVAPVNGVPVAPAAKPVPIKKPAKVQKPVVRKASVTPLKRMAPVVTQIHDSAVDKAAKRVAAADAKVKQAKTDLRKARSEAAKARAELAKLTSGTKPPSSKPPKPRVLPRPIAHPGGKVHVSLDSSQVKPGQTRTITQTSADGSATSSVTVSRG
ncbi:hypothetical protein SAMN05421504_10179 [Amycolatopsis xylanica]|uniref:Uncharacterized protein n=1 Tax=Amycolatopsis xylanica TaxID=589385 RepID=A0A1H2S1K2_9PSEU|nr:hypothetical protein [Amycolatopsis xylanica]SDW25507.1 hypothetical protein SAMN05421504_10179 [Amycolatopsis xylanica]